MQGQRYPIQGCQRWGCDGDLVCTSSILQHFQPSQLTDYSPRCGTTSYVSNVSVPMYFNPRKRSRTNLPPHYLSIQEWWKVIRDRDRDGTVFGKPDENEIKVFKYIHVSGSLVWAKARTLNAIPIQVLIASALLREFERKSALGEHTLARNMLTEDLIRSGSGLKLQQIQALRDSNHVPGHVIAAWLSQRKLKPGLVTFLDPVQQVRLQKRSKHARHTNQHHEKKNLT